MTGDGSAGTAMLGLGGFVLLAGAEGSEDFTGSALGWTSGRTAWLVVTPSADDTGTLVRALQPARRAG